MVEELSMLRLLFVSAHCSSNSEAFNIRLMPHILPNVLQLGAPVCLTLSHSFAEHRHGVDRPSISWLFVLLFAFVIVVVCEMVTCTPGICLMISATTQRLQMKTAKRRMCALLPQQALSTAIQRFVFRTCGAFSSCLTCSFIITNKIED
ncbi:hypothetical protein TRVL_08586 [Trypanosoma vivax]|nr:hypothetical protein TRVL_08586 [Trypanosoma vivax]